MAQIGGTVWRASSYSGANGGQCIEVAGHRDRKRVLVRDSKNQAGVMLRFSPQAWSAFVDQVKARSI